MSEHIHITDHDGVRTIRMARPDKKNALTMDMYAAMAAALSSGDADPAVRAFVLTGTGDAFTAGNDLHDFLKAGAVETSPAAQFLTALAQAQKPILAAVNGIAVGIGVTMLLHCDFVYAAEDAVFQMPFVNLGLVPEAAATLLLPQCAGYRRAVEATLLGLPFSAGDARSMGIVNKIHPAADLVETVGDYAAMIAEKPPQAVQWTKRLLKRPDEAVLDRMGIEFQVFGECLRSPELKAAIAAFAARKGE